MPQVHTSSVEVVHNFQGSSYVHAQFASSWFIYFPVFYLSFRTSDKWEITPTQWTFLRCLQTWKLLILSHQICWSCLEWINQVVKKRAREKWQQQFSSQAVGFFYCHQHVQHTICQCVTCVFNKSNLGG